MVEIMRRHGLTPAPPAASVGLQRVQANDCGHTRMNVKIKSDASPQIPRLTPLMMISPPAVRGEVTRCEQTL
jgi:hypothetical protein